MADEREHQAGRDPWGESGPDAYGAVRAVRSLPATIHYGRYTRK
jgi:hypothetical protein